MDFKKSYLFKYTETKLISLFNVIHLDFNATIPAFQKFLNSAGKKKSFGCVFNQFCRQQWLLYQIKIFFLLKHLSPTVRTVNSFTSCSEMNQNRIFHIPKKCKHNLTGWWLTFELLSYGWCNAQLVKNFPAFHVTRRFITVFTRARHWEQYRDNWIQFTPYYFNVYFNVILSPTPMCPKIHFPFRISYHNFVRISQLPHVCYTVCPSHIHSFDKRLYSYHRGKGRYTSNVDTSSLTNQHTIQFVNRELRAYTSAWSIHANMLRLQNVTKLDERAIWNA
jgi:hypothetical protein